MALVAGGRGRGSGRGDLGPMEATEQAWLWSLTMSRIRPPTRGKGQSLLRTCNRHTRDTGSNSARNSLSDTRERLRNPSSLQDICGKVFVLIISESADLML